MQNFESYKNVPYYQVPWAQLIEQILYLYAIK